MPLEPNPVFTPEAVLALDAQFAAMRDSTCVVERPVQGRSVGGAPLAASYTPVGSTKCRVKASGRMATEGVAAGRWGPSGDYELRFPRDLPFAISTEDRVQVIHADGSDGGYVYVTSAGNDQTWGWELIVSSRSQN